MRKKISPIPPDVKVEAIPGTEYVLLGNKVGRVLDPANHIIADGKVVLLLKNYPKAGQETFNLIINGQYIRATAETIRKKFITDNKDEPPQSPEATPPSQS